MSISSLDATALAFSHPDMVKRTSMSAIAISIIMLLAGIFLFASIFCLTDRASSLSMALMVLGTVCLLVGMYRLFWRSQEIVYLPTGSPAIEQSLFFDVEHLHLLKSGFEGGILDTTILNDTAQIRSTSSGNVRLDVILSRDKRFAAVQLFQFVPYNYEPVTSAYYFKEDDAAALSAFLGRCKGGTDA